MADVARLSTPRIRRHVGDSSIHKAKAYTHRQAWSNLRLQGATVKGECRGTAPAPYRVQVRFDGGEIVRAECSCPIGAGGHCKHVAALLLVYRDRPEAFSEEEELEQVLERRSSGELIALIRQMIRRAPELELLLHVPLPGSAGETGSGDPEPFRRQARAAFQLAGDVWNAVPLAARELHDIVTTGDEFRERGEWAAAAAAYRGVAEVALEAIERVHDDEGELQEVIGACADGMCRCFEGTPPDNSQRRAELLRALFDLYVADEAHGGLCAGDSIFDALIRQTTDGERRLVAGWIRDSFPAGHSWIDDYRREQFGELLLQLEGETLDDEAFLRVCRETARTDDLVDRLLRLGRQRDALQEMEAATDQQILILADRFVAHGLGELAEPIVRARAANARLPFALPILDWLRGRGETRGDSGTACALARRLFDLEPSLARYADIHRLTPSVEWPAVRSELRGELERRQKDWLLLDIELHEGNVAAAIARVAGGRNLKSRTLDVARAAEQSLPREALALYRAAAESLIEQRHRSAYRTACTHLAKVQALSGRLGERAAWNAYIQALRVRHRSLRAFHEELDHAKLI